MKAQDKPSKEVVKMATQEKVEVPPAQELVGITTALTGIESVKARLEGAIKASTATDAQLTKFRAELNAMPSGLMKSHIVAHQAELEAEIADASRKAVNDAVKEVFMHMSTVNTLAGQIKGKYGKPEVTVKRNDKGNYGNITDGNKASLEAELRARGFNPVFAMLDDGIHYSVSDGTRHSKYTSNVLRDWYH